MEREEADRYLNRTIQVLCSNKWTWTISVIEVTKDSIIGYDKRGLLTSIRFADIMVVSEVQK